MYYVISEDFYINNSSITLDDRCEHYSHLNSPTISISTRLNAFESENEKYSRDFHMIGELIVKEELAKIFLKKNIFNVISLPVKLDQKNSHTMLSVNNVLSCLDQNKSVVIENPCFPDEILIDELYIDLKKLDSYEPYLTRMFIIKEAHDYIIVNQVLGEELLKYIKKNPYTTLVVKPIHCSGQVPRMI